MSSYLTQGAFREGKRTLTICNKTVNPDSVLRYCNTFV